MVFPARNLAVPSVLALNVILILFYVNCDLTPAVDSLSVLQVAHGSATNGATDRREPQVVENDWSIISWQNVAYRYPGQRMANLTSRDGPSNFIIGVESKAKHAIVRQLIRKAWASKTPKVFFVIAGPWSEIENEFHEFEDIIWVDRDESVKASTWKVFTFFDFVYKHIPEYSYILKVQESIVPNFKQLEKVSKPMVGYGGECQPRFLVDRNESSAFYIPSEEFGPDTLPSFPNGLGYLLPQKIVECHVRAMSNTEFVRFDSVWLGIIAKRCQAPCQPIKNWLSSNDPNVKPILRHIPLPGLSAD